MSEYMKNVRQANMQKSAMKLCEISGILQALSRMAGCTITSAMTDFLYGAVEDLVIVIDELQMVEPMDEREGA